MATMMMVLVIMTMVTVMIIMTRGMVGTLLMTTCVMVMRTAMM